MIGEWAIGAAAVQDEMGGEVYVEAAGKIGDGDGINK